MCLFLNDGQYRYSARNQTFSYNLKYVIKAVSGTVEADSSQIQTHLSIGHFRWFKKMYIYYMGTTDYLLFKLNIFYHTVDIMQFTGCREL